MITIKRERIIAIISDQLRELCDAAGIDAAECDERAVRDEATIRAKSTNGRQFGVQVAEYFAAIYARTRAQ